MHQRRTAMLTSLAVGCLALAGCAGASGGAGATTTVTVTATNPQATDAATATAATGTSGGATATGGVGAAHLEVENAVVADDGTVTVHVVGTVPQMTLDGETLVEEMTLSHLSVTMVWADGGYERSNDALVDGAVCVDDGPLVQVDVLVDVPTDDLTPPQGVPVTVSACDGAVTAEGVVPE